MPLHNLVAVDIILGAVDPMKYTPLGYMDNGNSADEEYWRALAVMAVLGDFPGGRG
jgi:hypothetical protein